MIFTTALTDGERERHLPGVPTALAVISPPVLTSDRATFTVAVNASRVTDYRVDIATDATGPAIQTSGDRALTPGQDFIYWGFSDLSRAEDAYYCRVTYWHGDGKRRTTQRRVPMTPIAPLPDLGTTWPLDSSGLRWDDRLVWSDGGVSVTPTPTPTPTPAPGGTPTPEPEPTPTQPSNAPIRWFDSQIWSDANVWRDTGSTAPN